MKNKLRFQLGFTLIELLVVMGTLAVLAGVVMVSLNPQGQATKEKDLKRKADIAKMQSMLERYYTKAGAYPPAGSMRCGNTLRSPDGTITYGTVPCAPNASGTDYGYTVYVVNSSAKAYCLRACFENRQEPARDEVNPAYCGGSGCDEPTSAELGSNCAEPAGCPSDRRSYTILSP